MAEDNGNKLVNLEDLKAALDDAGIGSSNNETKEFTGNSLFNEITEDGWYYLGKETILKNPDNILQLLNIQTGAFSKEPLEAYVHVSIAKYPGTHTLGTTMKIFEGMFLENDYDDDTSYYFAKYHKWIKTVNDAIVIK